MQLLFAPTDAKKRCMPLMADFCFRLTFVFRKILDANTTQHASIKDRDVRHPVSRSHAFLLIPQDHTPACGAHCPDCRALGSGPRPLLLLRRRICLIFCCGAPTTTPVEPFLFMLALVLLVPRTEARPAATGSDGALIASNATYAKPSSASATKIFGELLLAKAHRLAESPRAQLQ